MLSRTITMQLAALAFVVGLMVGMGVHKAMALASDSAPCKDEVISIDYSTHAVSCSRSDMTSELRDGYLVCKCKKK